MSAEVTDRGEIVEMPRCPWCGGDPAFVENSVSGKASEATFIVMCDGDCPFRLRKEERSVRAAALAWNDYVQSWHRRLA